jgi:hypothetical protein
MHTFVAHSSSKYLHENWNLKEDNRKLGYGGREREKR